MALVALAVATAMLGYGMVTHMTHSGVLGKQHHDQMVVRRVETHPSPARWPMRHRGVILLRRVTYQVARRRLGVGPHLVDLAPRGLAGCACLGLSASTVDPDDRG